MINKQKILLLKNILSRKKISVTKERKVLRVIMMIKTLINLQDLCKTLSIQTANQESKMLGIMSIK